MVHQGTKEGGLMEKESAQTPKYTLAELDRLPSKQDPYKSYTDEAIMQAMTRVRFPTNSPL